MSRALQLPRLADDPHGPFPPTSKARRSPNGLLAWGGDLHPERVLKAYRMGVFPWFEEGQPPLWWSPAPRCVLFPPEVYTSRRTRRRFNTGRYRITADTAFDDVIAGCAEPRKAEESTWITAEMRDAYSELHRMGYAHSVEVWGEDVLIGGIYGLLIGRIFFGESMFSRATDTSKIALIALCRHLEHESIDLLDCQVGNPHLYRMGARDITRKEFELRLEQLVGEPAMKGPWTDVFHLDSRW